MFALKIFDGIFSQKPVILVLVINPKYVQSKTQKVPIHFHTYFSVILNQSKYNFDMNVDGSRNRDVYLCI